MIRALLSILRAWFTPADASDYVSNECRAALSRLTDRRGA